jgi:N-formylglutamate amidohydrolase
MPLSRPAIFPPSADVPVLLSVPHSGRDYPDWLVGLAKGGRSSLHALEDPLVDELVAGAISLGMGAIVAQAPRAAVDCNRAEDEIDPTVIRAGPISPISPRARGGLGIVPGRTTTHGPLWRQPIPRYELEERLEQAHRPYHRAIETELCRILDRFGCALLLDCHSMPPPAQNGPQIVIGDRYGQSAAPWITAEAVKIVASTGFRCAVNQPFAGGYVVQRHGAPAGDVHALQIEVDRRCYLAPDGTERGPGFAKVARMFEQLAQRLGNYLLERRFPAAAE